MFLKIILKYSFVNVVYNSKRTTKKYILLYDSNDRFSVEYFIIPLPQYLLAVRNI